MIRFSRIERGGGFMAHTTTIALGLTATALMLAPRTATADHQPACQGISGPLDEGRAAERVRTP